MIYIIIIIMITSIIILIEGEKIGERGSQKIIDRVYIIIYTYMIYYIYNIIYKGEERIIRMRIWNREITRGEEIEIIIDRTTIIMVGLITIIGYIIIKYSNWYIPESKFIGMLNIFMVSMIIIVSTNNIIGIYIGWEWVGICSYILINYWYRNVNNNKSGIKAILYNKIGDIGILLSIIIIYNIYNRSIIEILEYNNNTIISIGIAIGAIAKSAQYIMHPWLGDAMAGPTPVSALLHAATMVTAGIILIIRTMKYNDNIWDILLYISIITIIFGGLTSLVQNDIKKIIAYSTCSQLGYMFILLYKEIPLVFSIYHLFTHAFFKALLFICAGIIIHYSNNEQDIRRLHINNQNFLYNYLLFSSLSLISFPYTSGFYSKESILLSIDNPYLYTILVLGALITILYTTKLIYMIYINNNNINNNIYNFPISIYLYILPLLLGSLCIGYYTNTYYLSQYYYLISHTLYLHLLPLIGLILYMNPYIYNYIYNKCVYHMYNMYNNKSYIDDIINIISYRIIEYAYVLYKYIDKGILEYLGPNNIYRYIYNNNIYRINIYSKNSIILIIILILISISLYNP